ncbi:MAG: U32 family peptidase [Prevotellaceae bacterium]|jgi:putative protease|nr:U32 family peptidase [Prevotellaceae bacterium]
MTRNKLEIMSPAGNFECLAAAIQGGANSVYFGVDQLNMRSRSANNFKADNLPEIVKICKENIIKSYLTLNTVMYDEDIPIMQSIVDKAKDAGVSAIIASDQAIIMYAWARDMDVHISTQINISNALSLKFYAQYANVVVLARELNLTQVANIHRQIRELDIRGPQGKLIQLEMFVHGALCMSVSGKCYLSLHEYDSSANRGSCFQTCRRSYIVTDKETGRELEVDNEYIMSPKDLCAIGFMDKMAEAGVSVFKIEGRARSAEYVKTVTRCYSEAAQAIADGTYSKEKIEGWTGQLKTVFNRGFWDGYYLGQYLGEWSEVYGNKATQHKEYIGKTTNYFSNIGVAEFLIEADELKVGDKILIIGPTTGVIETSVTEIRIDLQPVDCAPKGVYCSVATPDKIRRGDKLYKLVDNI